MANFKETGFLRGSWLRNKYLRTYRMYIFSWFCKGYQRYAGALAENNWVPIHLLAIRFR